VQALIAAATALAPALPCHYHVGINASTDTFYQRQERSDGACLAIGVLSAWACVLAQEGPGPRSHGGPRRARPQPSGAGLHCHSARQPWWWLPPNRLVWAALVARRPVWVAVSWIPLAGLLASVSPGVIDWLLEGFKRWRAT
jgi:hypothetical protein